MAHVNLNITKSTVVTLQRHFIISPFCVLNIPFSKYITVIMLFLEGHEKY